MQIFKKNKKLRAVKQQVTVFYKSKFTVVGTPTISENGIASNFAKNSYATGASIPLSTAKSFSVKCRLKTPKEEDSPYINTYWWLSNNCYLCAYNAASLCVFNTVGIKGTGYRLFEYEKDTLYDVEYTSDIENNQQTLVYTKVYDGTTHTATSNHTFEWADATLRIGVWGEYAMDYGNIDLSKLSVKVDGVEVFAGTKTTKKLFAVNEE